MRAYRASAIGGILLVGAVALFQGCSGGDEKADEPTEEEPANKAEEPAEPPATPPPAPAPAPAPTPAPPPAPAEPAGFEGAKVTRYVTTIALKVHAQPSKESPVVGWVKKGDKVDVVINGDWAKLDKDKYISNKFLSDNPVAPAPAAKKKK